MCGGAFSIVFVCAYVRGGGGGTVNRDKGLGIGVHGDVVWWLEIGKTHYWQH